MARRGRIRKTPKAPKLDEVRNEINVTPLVDVCLVLLIIFMVVLPLMERGKQIPLPLTVNHESSEDTQQPIVVVTREGTLYVGKKKVKDLEEVKKEVKKEWESLTERNSLLKKKADERDGEGRVLLKAEPDTLYNKVYPIILALHEINASGIDLGTNEYIEKGGI